MERDRNRAGHAAARPFRAALLSFLLAAGHVAPAAATYSIVARDPATGQIGAAVQSHWFQVSRVIWVRPGVGAVATQSLADFAYGPAALELLALGRPADRTLKGLLETDENPEWRQVAVLDADGLVAAHTGERCIAEAGHVAGEHFSAQANLMARDGVPLAMARAFEQTEGDLAERLVAALEAAQAAGGDIRGQQSAALLVAGPEDTGRPWEDLVFDLRVDDHPAPVGELRRLLATARAYRAMDEGDRAIEREDFAAAEALYGSAASLVSGNPEPRFWYGISLANAGRIRDAEKVLAEVYAEDAAWRELPARLVPAGLLPDDPELVLRLANAGR